MTFYWNSQRMCFNYLSTEYSLDRNNVCVGIDWFVYWSVWLAENRPQGGKAGSTKPSRLGSELRLPSEGEKGLNYSRV